MSRQPLKKFYQLAEAGTAPGADGVSHVVRLDGRVLKTPLKETLVLPTAGLAAAVAAEWQAQGEYIVPDTMPLTQLANTMQDKAAGPDRAAMNAEVCKYGESDLVCYLATHPPELVKRQEDAWLPLLHWLAEDKAISLQPVRGIQYCAQVPEALQALQRYVADLPAAAFTAAQAVLGATGSIVIALALADRRITPEEAYVAACVDELYQLEMWGNDSIARERLERIRHDVTGAARFLALCRD